MRTVLPVRSISEGQHQTWEWMEARIGVRLLGRAMLGQLVVATINYDFVRTDLTGVWVHRMVSCIWVHKMDVRQQPFLSRQKAEIHKQILKKTWRRWQTMAPHPIPLPCTLAFPAPSHRDATTPSPLGPLISWPKNASCSRIPPRASPVSEIFNHSDTCAVPSVRNAVGLLILLKLCPVFTFLQLLLTKKCELFTHTLVLQCSPSTS